MKRLSVLLAIVVMLVGCSINSISEEEKEIIDATITLIESYEEDFLCYLGEVSKIGCMTLKTESDFDDRKARIKELQDKLQNEYKYTYVSKVDSISWADIKKAQGTETNEFFVNPYLFNNDICREIETDYTYQGLNVKDCSYSSYKNGKISITVKNNSGVDLKYLEVEIYGLDSNGNTIFSDYTNHGSTIRNGATQTLEAYVDYASSYEVEISRAVVK